MTTDPLDDIDDIVLGGEAMPPQVDFGPPIPSIFPSVDRVAEFREIERRVRQYLSPMGIPAPATPKFVWEGYRRFALRHRSEVVDEYGRDPVLAGQAEPLIDFMYKRYFRVDLDGIENIPSQGPGILVANHSGILPLDAILLSHGVHKHHPASRLVRPLLDDRFYHAAYLGVVLTRMGAVRACPQNAIRLLDAGQLVSAFPEGHKGSEKLYRDRYRLQRFGRGGFIKLALRTGAPIIPISIIGNEDTHPLIGKAERLGRAMGFRFMPITPTFPLLGAPGLLPIPAKWKIRIHRAVHLEAGPDEARDPVVVSKLTERVRSTIQSGLHDALTQRRSVVFG